MRVAEIEPLQVVHVAEFPSADRVQLVLHLGGEPVIDQVGKMVFEQPRDGERGPGRHQDVTSPDLEDVLPGENRVDDRGIGARPPDAHLLQRPGKRGFAVPVGRLGGVALGLQLAAGEHLAHRDRRQHVVPVGQFGLRIVGTFHVRAEITRKLDRLAADLERGPVHVDGDRDPVTPGVGHLAGNGPLPDQVVELELVGAELAANRLGYVERMARRTNRFVGLLGILDLGPVGAWFFGQILFAVLGGDQVSGGLDCHRGQVRRVGSHVGDVAVFVQALSHLHRVARRVPALPVRLLLKRAGSKRRIGPGAIGLVFQVGHAGLDVAEPLEQFGGLRFAEPQKCRVLELARGRVEVPARGDFPPVDRNQGGLEALPACLGEDSHQVPERGAGKGHPLPFPLDDQPNRHALYPAGRQPRPDLPPQQG